MMSQDKYDMLGPIYGRIGGEIAHIVGGDADGAYLYAEAGEGWCGYSVFKDEGEAVRYYRPTSELSDLVREAWTAEDPAKRWAVMEYEIKDGKFDAQFLYSDQVDIESFDIDRREIALKKRFGDKPIIYPPMPHID